MKKRIVAIVLCVLLGVVGGGLLTACGPNTDTVVVVTRESGSGTRDAFESLIKDGEGNKIGSAAQNYRSGMLEKNGNGIVKMTVSGNKSAIGYISAGSVDATVKALSVGGIKPSDEAINNDTYKLWRPFEILYQTSVVGAEGSGTALQKNFKLFLESTQAQETIVSGGFVKNAEVTTVWTKDTTAVAANGGIKISGSSSIDPLMDKLIGRYCELTGYNQNIFSKNSVDSSQGKNDIKAGTVQFGMASSKTTLDASFVAANVAKINGELQNAAFAGQLCRDGIAMIVHKSNAAVDTVTIEQILDIYTGRVTLYSQLKTV